MFASKMQLQSILTRQRVNLLLLIFSLLWISACGGATASPTAVATEAPTEAPTIPAKDVEVEPPTVAPAADSAGEQEAELIHVNFGVNAEFEPFVFKNEQGAIVGFDIALLDALSQVGNFEFTYTDLPFEELLPKVESGELDAAISAITVTPERAQRVNFTDIYFRSGQAPVSYFNPGQGLAVRTDEATIMGKDSLVAGVKVGVKTDTTGAAFVADETAAEAVPFPESNDALNALSEGMVDAVVVDIPVIVRFIEKNPNAGIRISGGPLTDEEYAIAVNPARTDILERLNSALAKIRESGLYDQLFEKWFGSP
ncbi:MAG: transporter substrate-binding domain-containing protein [Caldilineaceae bacterium]|nr:transporter substrate-binding domain-containing protein [Caldilineaceae bacterium]